MLADALVVVFFGGAHIPILILLVNFIHFVHESQQKYCINFRHIYLHRHRVLLA